MWIAITAFAKTRRKGRGQMADELSGKKVYTVRCVTIGDTWEPVHIFSSLEAAERFCEADPRTHVVSDYVIDCPERMEQRTN